MFTLQVMAMLSSKPAVDGDEEKDEGGFGASIAMMPLGAAGGVCWGLLSSFGAGVANASPTFSFDAYILEQFYGTATQAIEIVVMSLLKQGVVQVCCSHQFLYSRGRRRRGTGGGRTGEGGGGGGVWRSGGGEWEGRGTYRTPGSQ